MIVVDTNIVAYTLIEGTHTPLARELWRRNPDWRLPPLWRHEFLNVLATFARRSGLEPGSALAVWRQALELLSEHEIPVDAEKALRLAITHRISAYDAQFIALAQNLKVLCVTEDSQLLKTFPHHTVSLQKFIEKS